MRFQGQLFCKKCYQTLYNPQIFNMAGYDGSISDDDRNRYFYTFPTKIKKLIK